MKAADYLMTRKLGFKIKVAKPQEPIWKKRIKDKINSLWEDLSHLDRWSKTELYKEKN